MKFGAEQDDAVYLLSHWMPQLRTAKSEDRERLEARLNAVYKASEESEDALDAACPALEHWYQLTRPMRTAMAWQLPTHSPIG